MDRKELPAELAHFVRQALASGTFQSEEELVVEAVRLLKERVLRREALQQRNGGTIDTPPQTPDEYVRAIAQALATGDPVRARALAMEGAEHYPQHAELHTYAHVLAPPTGEGWPRYRHHGQPSRRITPGSPCTGKPIAATGLHCGQGSYCMPRPPWMTSSHTSAMSAGVAFC